MFLSDVWLSRIWLPTVPRTGRNMEPCKQKAAKVDWRLWNLSHNHTMHRDTDLATEDHHWLSHCSERSSDILLGLEFWWLATVSLCSSIHFFSSKTQAAISLLFEDILCKNFINRQTPYLTISYDNKLNKNLSDYVELGVLWGQSVI